MSKASLAQQDKTSTVLSPMQGVLQRKCTCGNHGVVGGECTECAMKRRVLQRKLTISASNDPLELKADRATDRVLARHAHPIDNEAPSHIQRQCASGSHTMAGGERDESGKNSQALQRARLTSHVRGTEGEGEVPLIVHEVLHSLGQPLDSTTRAFVEPRFGYDFSQVRVHADAKAAESTRGVNALAYTVGRDIAFLDGQYQPSTADGMRLLVHELTHVIQQQSSTGSVYPTMLPDGSERKASQNERCLFSDNEISISQGSLDHRVLRKPDPNNREEPEYFIVPEIHDAFAEREREVPPMRSAPQKTCEPFHGPPNQPRRVSQQLIDRLMGKYAREGDPGEGCKEEPYIAGKTEHVCTINYGRQIPTCPIVDRVTGRILSMDERKKARLSDLKCRCEGEKHFDCKGKDAEMEVRKYVKPKADEVHKHVRVNLTQSEFDALVDVTLHVGHIPEKLLQAFTLYWCTGEGMNYVRSVYLNTALTRPGLKRIEPGFVSRRKHRVWPWYMQKKLILSEQGDVYEQEADRIADQVMAASEQLAVRGAPLRIQSLSEQSNGQVDMVPASVDQTLASRGRPLEPALRQDMEQRFGYDFSRVRMHSGGVAEHSAQELNAHAYTVGQNIVFGAERLAPGTHEGRRLLAHELTHVVQQTRRGAPTYIARKQTPWPAWHQESFAAIARIAGPSDGKPADNRWLAMVVYLCRLPRDRAQSLRNRLASDAPGMVAGTDDFAVYVRNKFPAHHERLITVLELVNKGQRPTECELPKPKQEFKEPPKEQPQTESKPEPPRGGNALEDCTPTQGSSIRNAISRALSDLDAAIAVLEKRPLSDHAKNALFIIYRTSDDATGDSVLDHLRKIRAGLPKVPTVCDQPGDILTGCGGGTVAYTNMITGTIHLCMDNWERTARPHDAHPRALIHEGAHAFLGITALGDLYFRSDSCEDSASTAGVGTKTRIGLADSPACVTHHLTHRAAENVKSTKELHSGESLKRIIQTLPRGPISLGGNPARPQFILDRVPIVVATNIHQGGGFAFRWRLYDDLDRHYLLRGEKNDEPLDWLDFTGEQNAVIGRKTRDLLVKRGVTKGVIECTARIPNVGEKMLRLDLEFAP